MEDELQRLDVSRALLHISKLASYPRFPGSPGERQAQAYLRGAYQYLGLSFEEERFTYSTRFLILYIPLVCFLIGLLSLLTSLTYLWRTGLILFPALSLLVVLYLSFRWSGAHIKFARWGVTRESTNFIGKVASSSGGASEAGTVMLSAHYDSKSQLFPVVLRASLFVLGFCNAVVWGVVAFVLAILSFAGKDLLGSHVGFYISLLPAAFSLALVFNFTGNRSPGALDNASGEALILELARVLKDEPLKNFDVLVASYGCEEVGLCGSIRYLLAHESEFKRTQSPFYLINIDMPFTPSGKIYLNTGFEIPRMSTSSHLNHLAEEVAERMGIELSSVYLPTGAAADHMPWVARGFEATAFVSPTTYVHTSRDSEDRINRDALETVGEIVLGVLRRLDGETSSTS